MDFFNFLGDQFSDLGQTIVNSLPGSPIVWLQANSQIQQYLKWVNWFIPIYQMIPILETWLICVSVYVALQVFLRWAKVVE